MPPKETDAPLGGGINAAADAAGNTKHHRHTPSEITNGRQIFDTPSKPVNLPPMSANNNYDSSLRLINKKMTTEQTTGMTEQRLVVVRYFLDRPGYYFQHSNSSARFWKEPPACCTLSDIKEFLIQQNILDDESSPTKDAQQQQQQHILAEVYLDQFSSYMFLDVPDDNDIGITFDFTTSTRDNPTLLDIRLTDLNISNTIGGGTLSSAALPKQCNMSPAGLFAFTMVVGLEATSWLIELTASSSSSIAPSFNLIYGPYAFFVGGLLQLLVGICEVTRNNIYGAVAFSSFGCFWLANGTKLILTTYFPGQLSEEILEAADPWGHFVRELYILLLVVCLLKQTLIMNKTTTALICVLIVKLIVGACDEFGEGGTTEEGTNYLKWTSCIATYLLSVCGAYVFWVEFTNEVYHPLQPYRLFPWSDEHSPEESFGATGRVGGLQSQATNLRRAEALSSKKAAPTLATVRSVRPEPETTIHRNSKKLL